MHFLLDTNICIYIAKHRPPEVRERFAELKPDELGMSVITFGELLFGAEKSQHPKLVRERLSALRESIPVLPLLEAASATYGEIRASLEKSGTPIGANDLWIAAHALSADLTLVTNNEREFRRVPKLRVENWVTPKST